MNKINLSESQIKYISQSFRLVGIFVLFLGVFVFGSSQKSLLIFLPIWFFLELSGFLTLGLLDKKHTKNKD